MILIAQKVKLAIFRTLMTTDSTILRFDIRGNADLDVTGVLHDDDIENKTNQDEPILNETDDNVVGGQIS